MRLLLDSPLAAAYREIEGALAEQLQTLASLSAYFEEHRETDLDQRPGTVREIMALVTPCCGMAAQKLPAALKALAETCYGEQQAQHYAALQAQAEERDRRQREDAAVYYRREAAREEERRTLLQAGKIEFELPEERARRVAAAAEGTA